MKHRLDSVNMLTMVSNKTQNKCQELANNCYTSAMNDMGINFNRGRKSFKAKMWQKFGLAMEYLKISSAFLGVSVMISENICKIKENNVQMGLQVSDKMTTVIATKYSNQQELLMSEMQFTYKSSE